jgi:hypothetical protein
MMRFGTFVEVRLRLCWGGGKERDSNTAEGRWDDRSTP